ncbi:hypothetical protein [Sphingomonas sp. PP-CE-3G-477]|uniref:hypothetical protein n=1 Tax=Sphingomonas sp. PP-CE-3G-477 TaxID=2135660 RepID=UPI0015E6CFD0|nr:hypothetical protein [Sphingomonas sp. PP-CE-3G-477]
MRTHTEIVNAAGADRLATLRRVSLHTARSWAQRDSIPAEHWSDIVKADIASWEELGNAAAAKPRKPADQQVAA